MPAPPVPFGVPAQFRGQTLSTYQPTFREAATDWMRRALYSDDRAGQRKAEKLSNVLETMTPFGFATGIDDMKEAAGQGDYATAGLMGAMAMVPGPSPKIKAYHGSPHSFDRFSMDKIGTGEGAQAYLRGLYFAEAEPVAKGYRDDIIASRVGGANRKLKEAGGDIDAAMANVQAEIDRLNNLQLTPETGLGKRDDMVRNQQEYLAELAYFKETGKMNPGSMYEAEINATPEDFLDWDKALSEQPDKFRQFLGDPGKPQRPTDPEISLLVRQAERASDGSVRDVGLVIDNDSKLYQAAMNHAKRRNPAAYEAMQNSEMSPGEYVEQLAAPYISAASKRQLTAGEILKEMEKQHGAEVLRQKALESGIPGVRYLDAGSRGAGDGSRNYVVFDENLINIVRKYGIAGASAMLGYNILDGMDEAQAKELKKIDGSGW